MFLSHLHAWPDVELVREARPDAALAGFPGRCARLFPGGLAGPPSHSQRGQAANDVLGLAAPEKRVSSGHAAGRDREMWPGAPFLIILIQAWGRERKFIRFTLRSGDWE